MASSMEEAASQLEREHVHSVYQRIAPHFNDSRYKAWPKVKHFLLEQEPGSIVADIGCGNGKYLHINEEIFKLGCDVCRPLVDSAWSHGHEVQQCDGLRLPYRDACFDAVLSIAVIHHMSTKERRIRAIKEMARTLRVGGRIMIYVWAMEQKRRKFEKQDIFVPWNPNPPSSPALGASGDGDASGDKHRKVKSTSCVVDDPSQQKQLKLWFFSRSLDSVLDFSLLSRSSSNPEAIESKAQRTGSKGLIRQMSSLFSARTSLEEDVFTSEPYQQGHESENRIGNGMASVELVRDCSLEPLPDLVPHQEPLQNGEELDSGSIPEPSQRTDGFGLDCEQLTDSCLRYYHVFREGELMELIENHVDELHVLHTYLDHANWCVVAEKVQVWRV